MENWFSVRLHNTLRITRKVKHPKMKFGFFGFIFL